MRTCTINWTNILLLNYQLYLLAELNVPYCNISKEIKKKLIHSIFSVCKNILKFSNPEITLYWILWPQSSFKPQCDLSVERNKMWVQFVILDWAWAELTLAWGWFGCPWNLTAAHSNQARKLDSFKTINSARTRYYRSFICQT